jgi:hypothetical protein
VSKYGPVVVDGLERVIDFAGDVGPGIAKKVAAGGQEVGAAAGKLILPFEHGRRSRLSTAVSAWSARRSAGSSKSRGRL